MKRYLPLATLLLFGCAQPDKKANDKTEAKSYYQEKYRPQIHFSPEAHWMNDPNGMVKFGNTYHLFYQYYPDAMVWGPMHWGHATSTDMLHWKHEPVALYPDSLGYIFSGSAVVDSANTSGFGKNGKTPMVAIFTHHLAKGEKEGRSDYQNQSLAFSLDSGKTWTKYAQNPVLKSPGIKDFRDPKVHWYAPQKKWVMTLATTDHITFYSSKNLKDWQKESEFGQKLGEHGGVWECPDLFPLEINRKQKWVLLVSINPGGPVGGSATQYFVGDFDGKTFTPAKNSSKWLDTGSDNYAGITWGNTGSRHIFLGWMSNWLYADKVPTNPWRSAMTVPRELGLKELNGDYFVTANPVAELTSIESESAVKKNISAKEMERLFAEIKDKSAPFKLNISAPADADFTITLSNDENQRCEIGYDARKKEFFTDRRFSGVTSFNKDFARVFNVKRTSAEKMVKMSIVADWSSVELFGDEGLNVMTNLVFPSKPYDKISVKSSGTVEEVKFVKLKSVWEKE